MTKTERWKSNQAFTVCPNCKGTGRMYSLRWKAPTPCLRCKGKERPHEQQHEHEMRRRELYEVAGTKGDGTPPREIDLSGLSEGRISGMEQPCEGGCEVNELLDQPIQSEEEAAQRVIEVINVAPKAIKNEEQYESGMSWLASVVKRRKAVEAFFEGIKKPLRQAIAAVKAKEDGILEPLQKEERTLKQLTGDFFMKKKREADEKQAEINRKHAQKVQDAIDAGKSTDNIAPPRVIDTTPATTVKSANGGPTATMRMVKNWRATKVPTVCQQATSKTYRCDHPALKELPDECWLLDTARANAVAKSGMSPALELYEVPSQAISG